MLELRPSTPEDQLLSFLQQWGAQPRYALAAYSHSPAQRAAAACAVAFGGAPAEHGGLQGVAVAWDLGQAFFLELTPRHLARALGAGGGETLRTAVAALLGSPDSCKVVHNAEGDEGLRTLLLAGKLEAWAGGECCGGWSPPQRCVGVCRAGLSLGGPLEDTRAAHWLLAPDAPAPDCTLPALHATLLRENQARDRSPAR